MYKYAVIFISARHLAGIVQVVCFYIQYGLLQHSVIF